MTHEYFGVVTKQMGSGSGEVRGLARLEKGGRDLDFDPKQCFEPRGYVFVPRLPDLLRVGTPVAFDAEPNPHPKGSDLWWVRHGHRVESSGSCVLDAATSLFDIHQARPVLRPGLGPAPGSKVYLRYQEPNGSWLRGPWTLKNDQQLDAAGSAVLEWPDEICSQEDHFKGRDDACAWEVLLGALDPNRGRRLDTLLPDQLASWFVDQAERIPLLEPIIKQLHRSGEQKLKREFGDLAGEPERRLFEHRFERVLSIFETIELGRSELERIAKAPAFDPLWRKALEAKKDELTAKAEAALGGKRDQLAALEKEIHRLQGQKGDLEAGNAKLLAKEGKKKSQLATLRSEQRDHEAHVRENQQRLLRDARALTPLLVGPIASAGRLQPVAVLPAFDPMEPAPAADNAGSLCGAAVSTCRLTLILDPFWARELAAERAWRMFVLQAEPHWLCFDDAWRAGVHEIVELAAQDCVSTLLHLQDLDRSPPELWFRPVLDLASGLRDTLLEGEKGWPENLRVTASLAPGPPFHPLSDWLLCHFAAPSPGPSAGPAAKAPTVSAGLSHFVERETKALREELGRRLASAGGESRRLPDLDGRAREVRLEWPLTFGHRSKA